MAQSGSKTIGIICILSFLFFLAIGFDVSPYLRGPAPYPPDWQWPYLFINTFHKVWFPLLVLIGIIFIVFYIEKNIVSFRKNEKKLLLFFVFLSILFQVSILYFSRAGIGVLVHRIINADLNGYFTASLMITDYSNFFESYNKIVLSLPQHAQGHPPGAILFFSGINIISSYFPGASEFTQSLIPLHTDVKTIWLSLLPTQRLAALISIPIILLLSSSSIIPLYYLGKYLYGVEVGIRSIFLYMVIPSVILFVPLNDIFLPFFSLVPFLLFLIGLTKNNMFFLFISGLIFFIGLFLSVSVVPVLLFFFLFYLRKYIKRQKLIQEINLLNFLTFMIGLFIVPILLYVIYGFNFLEMIRILLIGLPESREYTTWVFYNMYDFFIFLGIPIATYYFISIIKHISLTFKKKTKNIDLVLITSFVIIVALNLSGTVRGEVSRIWLPFVPFFVLAVGYAITKEKKLTTFDFLIILTIQATQVLIMQEFWVMLW